MAKSRYNLSEYLSGSMSRFYTGDGDDGDTRIISGGRIRKDSRIINAIGDVDELNSSIGVAIFYVHEGQSRNELKAVQNVLFSIGAALASALNKTPAQFRITDDDVKNLEESMERMNKNLPELTKFVLPGGTEASSHLHLSRAVARRAERSAVSAFKELDGKENAPVGKNVIRYLNRLSSFLFVCALYINKINDIDESNPVYRK